MPFKSYYTNPSFGQGIENISSALFPDASTRQADHLSQMRQRQIEQDINIANRDATQKDSLFDSIRGWENNPNADPTEAMARAAAFGDSGTFGNMGKVFGQQRFLTQQAGTDPKALFNLRVGMGDSPGVDSPLSFSDQDRISARNAQESYRQAMDVERVRQAGQTARDGAPGQAEATAAQRNHQWRIEQRMLANPSLNHADAQAAEFGDFSVGNNDVTGLEARRNRATGVIEPMQYPEGHVNELPAWARGETQFAGTPMQAATGIKGNIQQGVNAVLGGVGLPEAWPEVANYFTSVRRLRDESAIAYADQVNSRPAMAMVNMFKQLTVDPDRWMQGDEAVQRQLQELQNRGNRTIGQFEAEYQERAHIMNWQDRTELVSELQTLHNMRADTEYLIGLFGNMSGGRGQEGPPSEQTEPGQGGQVHYRDQVNQRTGERRRVYDDGRVEMLP